MRNILDYENSVTDIKHQELFRIKNDYDDDFNDDIFFKGIEEGMLLLSFSKVYKGEDKYFSIFYNRHLNIICSFEKYHNEFFITIVSPFLKNTITVNSFQSLKKVIEQISSEPVRALKVEDLPLISKKMKNRVRRVVLQELHLPAKSQIFTDDEIDFIYSSFCGMNDYYYNDDVDNISLLNPIAWSTFCVEKKLKEQVFKELPDEAEELLRYRNYSETESKVYSNFLKSSYR